MSLLRALCLVLAALVLAGPATAQLGLPADKGLPVVVRIGVAFVSIDSFDENDSTFKATVDIRITWEDLRLRLPPDRALDPPLVFREGDAAERLQGLWTPPIVLPNRLDNSPPIQTALRTYPDGRAELMRRVTGTFSTPFEVRRFPFDTQRLEVKVAMLEEPQSRVDLQMRQDDLDFSRAASGAEMDGWTLGRVDLSEDPLPGWYGAEHAQLVAALYVKRDPGDQISAIFIPLLASLLIPLLTIWLNRMNDGVFEIETFELVNLIVGGLFAVIALNFTVNADYGVLASGENAVSQLFALNYVALGVCLLINVFFYRYRFIEARFGRYVQEQAFYYIAWAVPLIVLVIAIAIVMVAVA